MRSNRVSAACALAATKASYNFTAIPGLLAVDVAANDVGVVDGDKAMFGNEAFGFADLIGKQRLDLGPIAFAAANVSRAIDDVDRSR